MKIHYQKSRVDNGASVIRNLIGLMGINVSKRALDEVKHSPNYPSLDSLANVLSDWNIENMGVRLSLDQLAEIPYPAIAHLNKNNGHFVVLQKIKDSQIQYMDPESGIVIESLEDFNKKWTGVVLLVQPNKNAGEENYKQKRKAEIIKVSSQFVSAALLCFALLFPAFLASGVSIPLYLVKIFGLTCCLVLFQKQFGSRNSYISSFCKLGSNSDCDAVIHSPASKLFGLIHLSELGVLYFLGSVILLVFSVFLNVQITGVFIVFNLLILPFTFFSVYYQWRVIKKWCPLCLIVMAIFWIEFSLLWPPLSKPVVSVTGLYLAFVSFSLPLAFWLAVREQFIDSFKVPGMARTLNKFMKSEKIFKALLEQEAEVNLGNFTNEIQVGATNPLVALTVVSNPMCGPCSYAHKIIEELVERFGEKLKVSFRFTVDSFDRNSDSTKMIRHIAAQSLTNSNGSAVKSLSGWYSQNGRANLKKWKEDHPVENINEKEVDFILQEHDGWCKKVNIQSTPTIFINGKRLPTEYTAGDLKYHIRHLIN